MINVIRKPVNVKTHADPLEIILPGHHTMKQKLCMLLQAIHYLKREYRFTHANQIKILVYAADEHQRPYTHFPDGTPINKENLIIEGPYHAAADEHKA